jgi:hypothetical protein
VTTIYDLDKQATPAPWTCWDDVVVKGDGPLTIAQFQDEKDARLAAYYRNSFMKALESLKIAKELLVAYKAFDDGRTGLDATLLIDHLKNRIKELEEMK